MAFASRFHWADYVVFAINLLISAGIGFYYGCAGQKTTKDFLVGGRSMSSLPVALSLLASFLSAPFLMGVPAEMYTFGTMYQLLILGQILSCFITAYTFVPIFHKMELTSAYEYLEHRFSKSVRIFGSVVFSVKMTLYMAVVIYAPSMAFEPVTGMPTWMSVLATGLVCTFYTAVGGMKAVVWADVVQMIIIFVGCIVLVVMGSIRAGGIANVFEMAYEGGRIDFYNFSPDPTARHTFWTQVLGGLFAVSSILSSNQVTIQRYLSIGKVSDVRKCMWYCIFFILVVNSIIIILGLVLYAIYGSCDPVTSGAIHARDQLVPMFVMDVLGNLHGMPGLFAAAVFSATLSTVSSGLNALAAVILLDMVKPAYKKITKTTLSEEASTRLSKILAAGMGFVIIGLAYLVPFLGPTVLVIALALFGMIGGPLLGLFSLAIFVPFCNWKGALSALISSLAITSWIAIGGIIYPNIPTPLPVRLDGCEVLNITGIASNMTFDYTNYTYSTIATSLNATTETTEYGGIWLYKISYMWLATISLVISLVVGITVSLVTGKQEKVDPSLVICWRDVGQDICDSITSTWESIVGFICCKKLPDKSDSDDYEVKLDYMDEKSAFIKQDYAEKVNNILPKEKDSQDHRPHRRSIYWQGPEIVWDETYISSI